MKAWDVAALGEALIDFTEAGTTPKGTRLFEQNPGGAPANVACAVSRLGGRAAFLGKVGEDMHGRFLRDTLAQAGVDVSGLVLDGGVFTTLAFVALGPGGERSFSFARRPGADTRLTPEELALPVLENCAILHVGSLSLTDEPARSATLQAVAHARAHGAAIAYDPNYRASLWPGEAAARQAMGELLPFADLVKLSEEETGLVTGRQAPREAAAELLRRGAACAVITLGAAGALVASGEGMALVPAQPAEVADTTGAGDAFWGAFLTQAAQSGLPLRALPLSALSQFARFANGAAGLCVGRRGGIPAMPTRAEVLARLAEG